MKADGRRLDGAATSATLLHNNKGKQLPLSNMEQGDRTGDHVFHETCCLLRGPGGPKTRARQTSRRLYPPARSALLRRGVKLEVVVFPRAAGGAVTRRSYQAVN